MNKDFKKELFPLLNRMCLDIDPLKSYLSLVIVLIVPLIVLYIIIIIQQL